VQKRGVGEKDFQFTTGKLGTASRISVSSSAFSSTLTVVPTELDIIWQTTGYTPPLYKGKALHAFQSPIDFIAVPTFVGANGAVADPKTLVYTWTRNGTVIGGASGYGKNVFSTNSGVLARPLSIEVKVATPDSSQQATRAVTVSGTRPEIIFYENHPLYGMLYNKALPEKFTLASKEVSVVATPYFFAVGQKDNSALSYSWQMNNQSIPNQEKPYALVLRRPETNEAGTANVSLTLQHLGNMLQYANASIQMMFGEEETNIFE
jgi:hypothetical protein